MPASDASDIRSTRRPRVAVVGAGISGLGAAHRLADACDVVVYERDGRLGGHADTAAMATDAGPVSVDTGFIVYTERTYPLLTELFRDLGVGTRPTSMSFSVTCEECGLQFAGGTVRQILRSISRRPSTIRLLIGITRFRRAARRSLAMGVPSELTLQQWCDRARVPARTISHFLVPLTASVWSTRPGEALDMPADTTLQFLDNHGLLSSGPPRWRTVTGGSISYVRELQHRLEQRGVEIRAGNGATSIERGPGRGDVTIADRAGHVETFDRVVVATHADHARALLADATELEHEILDAVGYTTNHVELHDDRHQLPRDHRLWAAWNYRLTDCAASTGPPRLTYQMNILQHLRTTRPVCVTVNAVPGSIPADRLQATRQYAHPRFDLAARAAQGRITELHEAGQTTTGTFFCGAWQRWGFHEDGLWSGYAAADALLSSLAIRETGSRDRDAHERATFA